MATIGLRDLFIAKCTEVAGGAEEYDTPRRLAKAIKADMAVEIAKAVLNADDSVDKIEKEFVKGALKLNTNDLTEQDAAELLGQSLDDDGVLFAGGDDDPPYFAVGFRAKKPGGMFKYIWLYKVKFQVPNETFDTKAEGITFNTPEIEGEFIKREDGLWKSNHTCKPDDPVAVGWFAKVREPKKEGGGDGSITP